MTPSERSVLKTLATYGPGLSVPPAGGRGEQILQSLQDQGLVCGTVLTPSGISALKSKAKKLGHRDQSI